MSLDIFCCFCKKKIRRAEDLLWIDLEGKEAAHVNCAYKDYTVFLKRAELNDPEFERKIKGIPDIERLRAEVYKRYVEVLEQRVLRDKISKSICREERYKRILLANEKIRRLEAELKAILKEILIREQREDLKEVLEKCWCCVKIEGHSGFMQCTDTKCRMHPKLSDFFPLAYGKSLKYYALMEKGKQKQKEINEIMYR